VTASKLEKGKTGTTIIWQAIINRSSVYWPI